MPHVQDGLLIDGRVTYKASPRLVHGPLKTIDAIVVHQTDSDSAAQRSRVTKRTDIYRHPDVSRKGEGEAASAKF